MERQKHGFAFEEEVVNKYGLIKSDGYTARFDALTNSKCPVSIKLEQKGSDVELADYFRNAEIIDDFDLIVGFWEGTKNNIVETHHLHIKGNEFHQLFDISFNDKFHELLEGISNDASDDARWKKEITTLRNEWKKATPNLIRPRFKRDHKSQKRIQCAINNKDFYSYFIPKYAVEE